MLTRRIPLLVCAIVLGWGCLHTRGAARAADESPSADGASRSNASVSRPNIVVILCDDLGYGDVRGLNPQGRIPTPRLDALAAQGMIFTDAHSPSSVCSPTRYGLLTGRYGWRSKLQVSVLGGLSPRLIEPGRLTVADMLRSHGYRTACIGKWHLGADWTLRPGATVEELGIESLEQALGVDYSRPLHNGPTSLGFDEFFGITGSLDMVPYCFVQNDRVAALPTVIKDFPAMLGRPRRTTRPGPAAPEFEAENVLPELTHQAVQFIRRQGPPARNGEPFFLYLPFTAPHTPIAPTAKWQGKSRLNPYADFVMQVDASIGQVLDELEQQQVVNNTLVIVASDNGCSPEAMYTELLAAGHNPSHVFRGVKADIYEGGHRVPLLARWPGRTPPGSQSTQLVCLTDLFATFAELVGAVAPDDAAEDSISFLTTLRGAPPADGARTSIVHHSIYGTFAFREGNWKLVFGPDSGGWSEPSPRRDGNPQLPRVQLFDLDADIAERMNLAETQPDRVAQLTARMEAAIANGRTTPGARQANTGEIVLWKWGR